MLSRFARLALVAVLALAAPLVARQQAPVPLDARRARILEIAASYATHEWRATPKNVLHGDDPDGVRVDTPDVASDEKGFATDGSTNVGVPYMWGGFSTLDEFDRGVAEGKLAGHIPKGRESAPSRHAVGVDCSGLVSLAWELPRKHSTRSIGSLCYRLDSPNELLPGDVLNSFNGHVVIVKEFVDAAKTRVRVYEAGIPSVVESEYDVAKLLEQKYVPLRYKPLDPRFAAESCAFRDPPRDLGPARFEPAGEALPDADAKAAVLALPGPFSPVRAGDRVALSWKTRRSDFGGFSEDATILRGIVRDEGDGGVSIHERVMAGGKRLDKTSAERADETLLERVARSLGGAGATPVVRTATVRRGTITLGDRSLPGESIALEADVTAPDASSPRVIRVEITGLRSPEVPLGGFVETKLAVHVAGGPGGFDATVEERLLDWERAAPAR